MDPSQHPGDYVNPADVFFDTGAFRTDFPDLYNQPGFASSNMNNGLPGPHDFTTSHQDSVMDLKGLNSPDYPPIKTEDSADYDFAWGGEYSTPTSNISNTTDPLIFSNTNSNANSPDHFLREQSHTSSPEAKSDTAAKDWDFPFPTDRSIHIPHDPPPPRVTIQADKHKTRAETQIKTTIIMDPLPHQFLWVRFPRRTLSKSKQLASAEDVAQNEEGNRTLRIETTLICASAIVSPEDMARALRRARGDEPMPIRPRGTQVSEIEKEDAAHPQNGGAVVICEGCKERERKRYDRKKKRNQDEENEWLNYEDERIIMINEKEFKRWQDVEPDHQNGSRAMKVEFAMRITCYCRHQEEKTPLGYQVIFTFRDSHNVLVAQKISEIIQITDDHKNREHVSVERSELTILTANRMENMPGQYALPMFSTYAPPTGYAMYSQPTTPVIPQFQSPMSPMETHYPINAMSAVGPIQPQTAFAYGSGSIAAPAPAPSFANHQRYQSYSNAPMLSPTEHFSGHASCPLQRPVSLDSFNAAFAGIDMYSRPNPYSQPFASQPPSRNVSRPASPTWDQGPAHRTKKMRGPAAFYMAEDPDHE